MSEILNYNFDNANIDGNKEPVIVPNVPTLTNKLTANEINGIRNKINEIILKTNPTLGAVPYFDLRLKLKGIVGGVPNTGLGLEIGDICHGFASDGVVWTNARYEGGDVSDRNNYTNLGTTIAEPVKVQAVITAINQTFVLNPSFVVGSVLKSRGELYKGTEWIQNDDVITILINVNTGNTLYFKP